MVLPLDWPNRARVMREEKEMEGAGGATGPLVKLSLARKGGRAQTVGHAHSPGGRTVDRGVGGELAVCMSVSTELAVANGPLRQHVARR